MKGELMALSHELTQQIEIIACKYPQRASALIPALTLVQRTEGGFISKEKLRATAKIVDVPINWAFGVHTYYSMFNQKPVGKYHLQVDTNIPATLMGALDILEVLKQRLGIKPGQTTADGLFTISTVECLASCGSCPVIKVNDRYYENVTPDKVDELVTSLTQGIFPHWKTASNYHSQCKVLLQGRSRLDSVSISSYMAEGGYKALSKAKNMKPEQVRAEVQRSEIRGRGGAGFPVAQKWGSLPQDSNRPVYLICNADEGEPGTFKDRQIMQFDPHLLIEGMAISAWAINARLGFIYIRGEFSFMADILEKSIEEAKKNGKLGEQAGFNIIVHGGAGSYICGEETALIASIEGKRGHPRLKPPFPAVEGLYGCPTIVNNVETLSNIPSIIAQGAEKYKKIGSKNNYGPKIFSISGHVHRPGVYEYPMGTPLHTLLEAAGGVKGKLKAIFPGGLSTPLLTAKEAKGLRMDYDSCQKAGTRFGTGSIIVLSEGTGIPEIALRTMQFYAAESCGQCTPCRQGSIAITRLLHKIIYKKGTAGDIATVLRLCSTIKGNSLCPAGDAFSETIQAMLQKFRNEFDMLVN